ncbi:hypothetical protein [Streptomyces sp. NPDC050149]|uniref:hypothetical protein n=1 Tax=unclassified Streptomyces TaxID=2593676 RepID=UPI0037B9A9AA
MISEPEMAGEFEASAEREVLADAGRRRAEDRPPRAPRPGSKWLWALGGAVVASAVWGAVLFADGSPEGAPELHGYRLDRDPCPDVRLKSIGAAIAPRGLESDFGTGMLRHAALDRVECYIPLHAESGQHQPDKGWNVSYTVAIRIALHKRTDPRAEFEAERNATALGVDPKTEVEAVPELGDKAYLLSFETADQGQELRVLEGGAVLSLQISALVSWDDDQPPEEAEEDPDLSPHKAAMISDMRDLMTDLKS